MAIDFESFRLSGLPPEERQALFKTVDDYAVYPLATLFTGKPNSGKTAYVSYAVRRWKNGEEGFGLVPVANVHPVFIAFDRKEGITGIECFDPFKINNLSCGAFSQFIEELCCSGGYNVVFIDSLRALLPYLLDTPHSLQVPYAYIGGLLAKTSEKLGIYIFALMDLAKTKGKVADIQAAIRGDNTQKPCRIVETTDSHIDLLFNWRSKDIKRRVMFGNNQNEIYPESESALAERLEAERYEKYGGLEQLRYFLSLFGGLYYSKTIRHVMSSTGWSSNKIHGLMVLAKSDGYLRQAGLRRGSYYLSEKGHEIVGQPDEPLDLSDLDISPPSVSDLLADKLGI